jgi:selenocysteine-specific elongation factor
MRPATSDRRDIFTVVLGTAGHIDHGKSTLVRRLTGIDPDRLPEEKAREMTIDLGFAPLVLPSGKTVGVIDVPGHERFVKNMVAGATGIDVGMLVVDANEGVMPQTREHVEIMQLLGVRAGLVALTKIDVAGPEMTALATADVRESLRGTSFGAVEIVPVSSVTGEGIERLLAEIERICREVGPRQATGPFRMPIQRVFSAKGFGTIVTGVPVSGRLGIGDSIEILPPRFRGKVRGIQAYKSEAEEARAGQSSALNVADIDYKAVARGMVAVEPGAFEATTLVEAELQHLASSRRPLRHRETVRFHAGTEETIGEVALLEAKELAPGATALVQLRLRAPVVVVPGDRFILRRHAESRTIGGGLILGASDHRFKAGKAHVLEALRKKREALGDPVRVLEEALRAAGTGPLSPAQLRPKTGLAEGDLAAALAALVEKGRAVMLRNGALYVHRDGFERAESRIEEALDAIFRKDPLRVAVERLELKGRAGLADDLFDAALEALLRAGRLAKADEIRIQKPGRAVALSGAQAALRERMLDLFRRAGFAPPSAEEAAQALGLSRKQGVHELKRIAGLLVEEKALVEVAQGMWFSREAVDAAREALFDEFRRAAAAGDEFSASIYREKLRTTRKFAIPLLEYFDAAGLTIRKGASRVLRVALPPKQ